MTKSTFKVFALLFGGLALVGCLFGIYRVWARPTTIGWTPKHLALPATSFSDRVEIYVGAMPLAAALSGKRLSFAANETIVPAPLAESDVTVSFNNTYQERAGRIPRSPGPGALPRGSRDHRAVPVSRDRRARREHARLRRDRSHPLEP